MISKKGDAIATIFNIFIVFAFLLSVVLGEEKELVCPFPSLPKSFFGKLFNEFSKINAITIKISKENPPIAGHYTSVSVELERSR